MILLTRLAISSLSFESFPRNVLFISSRAATIWRIRAYMHKTYKLDDLRNERRDTYAKSEEVCNSHAGYQAYKDVQFVGASSSTTVWHWLGFWIRRRCGPTIGGPAGVDTIRVFFLDDDNPFSVLGCVIACIITRIYAIMLHGLLTFHLPKLPPKDELLLTRERFKVECGLMRHGEQGEMLSGVGGVEGGG